MRKSFLSKISKIIYSKYNNNFSKLVIVLPSRRSSVFLTHELSKFITKPIWLPEICSIEDFIFNLNNLKRATSLELFFQFYQLYRSQVKSPHNIDRCYKWASSLMQDFNEIDKAYVNPKDIFKYLSDVKRIENWYLDINSNRDEINEYLAFFEKLESIYKEFTKKLLEKSIAYSGLSQRLIVDNLDNIQKWLEENEKQKIIFIGIDALSISQEKIIDYLLKNNLCDIFWDTDSYFINNIEQESGKFLRKYQRKWPGKFNKLNNDFLTIKKEISIIGTSKNINQSKLLASILNEKKYSREQLKKVAIILPNEDLLLSVLESIPEKIKDINVTMGYKLTHHPIVSLFSDLFNLYMNYKVTNIDSNNSEVYYLNKDISQLLQNPYFKRLLKSFNDTLYDDFKLLLKEASFNYTSGSLIKKHLFLDRYPILKSIFSFEFSNAIELTNSLLDLVSILLELIEGKSNLKMIEYECLYEIEEQLLLFHNFFSKTNETISISLYSILFLQALKNIQLNFSGEPLNGIQVMGLLESRTIDFDEVFILSANEGSLPPNNNTNSFIPFDVKLKFNIRTDLDISAIYANHFFNLIKRPHKTYIIYNQDFSSSSGEKSRFINQLLYEIKPLIDTEISIYENLAMEQFVLEKNVKHSILEIKDDYIINTLIELSNQGLSPSTINMYNYCKKQFYFEKIIGVREKKNSENDIDSAQLGSIIHRVLQKLYEPYINICLTSKIMNQLEKSIKKEINSVLEYYSFNKLDKGKNILAISAINRIIVNFIKHESTLVSQGNKITIQYLEYDTPPQNFNHSINVKNLKINLKGQIDRVDIYNDHYRIIDYKTGSVQDSDLKTNDISEIKSKPKILQLLLYAWLFSKKFKKKNIPLLAGVINLRARNFVFQKCSVKKQVDINRKLLLDFEYELHDIFLNMFDKNENFEHLERKDKCRFCD